MDGHVQIDSECDPMKIINRNYRSISIRFAYFKQMPMLYSNWSLQNLKKNSELLAKLDYKLASNFSQPIYDQEIQTNWNLFQDLSKQDYFLFFNIQILMMLQI